MSHLNGIVERQSVESSELAFRIKLFAFRYFAIKSFLLIFELPNMVGWLEINVPFRHKYGYIRVENCPT